MENKTGSVDYEIAASVSSVTLNPSTAKTITVGEKFTFTAAIEQTDAADKTVKWSVGGTDAVKLYSDEACTTEVGTEATELLTVYARGVTPGSAVVTVTSAADSSILASCNVTVLGSYPVWVGGTHVTSENMNDVLGDADEGASVRYTPAMGSTPATLTLRDAAITSTGTEDSHEGSAIYAEGDLTIDVTADSTVTGPDNYLGSSNFGSKARRNA